MGKSKYFSQKKIIYGIRILTVLAILPILGHYIPYFVEEYYSRPKPSLSIESFSVLKDYKDEWRSKLVITTSNNGENPTAIKIRKIKVKFNCLKDIPVELKPSKTINLEPLTTIIDTLDVPFPDIFDTLSYPKSISFQLEFSTLNPHAELYVMNDSAECIYIRYFFKDSPREAFIDSSNNQMMLVCRKYPIIFDGKEYMNMYYPRNTKVSHYIKDGKIYLFPITERKLSGSSGMETFEEFNFFPAEFIKDKIVMSSSAGLSIDFERNIEGMKVFEKITLNTDKLKELHFFNFKKQYETTRKKK